MTSPEYQAPTWVDEDDPDFIEGVSPDLGAGYLNQLSGAVEDHGQRLGAITPVVTNLQNTALDQAAGDNRYILQSNANGFAPAEATATALAGKVDTGDSRLTDSRTPTDSSVTDAKVAAGAAISADKLADGTTNKVLTAAERTKLAGLATIATSGKLADATDVTTTGAAVGQLLAVGAVSGAEVTGWELLDTAEITPGDIGAQPAGTYATLVSGTIPDAQIPDGITRDSELSAALGTKAPKITPTSTKTANYTAVAGDLVVCDATAGGFTVTLPAATAGARISIRKADTGPNAVTVAAAGADTIGTVNPVTSLTLPIAGNLELIGLTGGWVILSVGASTATLDTRYALPRLAAGHYFHTTSPAGASTNNNQGNGTLRLMPWWVPRTTAIDRIGAEVSAVGESGSKFRLGIYADNGNAYPGALLLDAGQIAADSATVQELTCSLSLPPGLYWVGGAVQSAPTTQPTMRINSTWYPPVPIAVGGLPTANSAAVGYSQTGVSGALPSTFSTTVSTAGSVTRVFARAA